MRNRSRVPSKMSQGSSRRSQRSEPEYAESTYITPSEARKLSRGNHAPHPDDCICTICNCGAHKCPPDRVQGKYDNLKSSYMADFKGAYAPPERPSRPQYVHKPRRFTGTTTNQADFCYKGVPERRQLVRLADNDLGAAGLPFEGITTNQHDFRKWQSNPAQPALKPDGRANILPDDRDFQSEFNSQFVPKGGAKRRSRAPQERTQASIPFEGTTTNQSDFKYWNSRPAVSYQRTTGYHNRPDDRNFLTEGRAEYTEKPFDHCPAVEVAVKSKPANGHVMVERQGQHWIHKDHPTEWEETQQQPQQMPMAY